jgi:cytochrome c-type biogenesis protein CcmH
MIGWFLVGALALVSFMIAAFVLRMPRQGWTLFAAALVFGLAGYAWQGSPDQPASPKAESARAAQSGEAMVAARQSLFDDTLTRPDYLITSDAFARRGQYDDAAALLRRGLRENPEHLEGWLALAMALVSHAEGNVTPASRTAFDRATRIDPANPAPRFFLGAAYLQGRQFREARAVWADLLEASPADAPWREDLTQRVAALDEMIANAPFLQEQRPQGQ